ncbi:hypothetical protein Tco_0925941 [Tanacetum coccineum]|uniref:Reverse transcriptase domain-containing protein n=1 Tax=Tanacetum coccineum TaxID=301880 RepID=A0ABQ5DAV6_9ASTR
MSQSRIATLAIRLDTFYNALNANDQDSLNSAAGGNFLDKMPRECLRIIERISLDVAALTTEVSELKNLIKTMLIDKQKVQAPATVKAVEQSCVTCGGTHSYKKCPATDGNVYQDNIQEYVSQAAAANFNQGNTNSRPPMVMAASNIPVSAEENLGDPIDIRVDIIHPEPVAAVAFPAAAIVRTQAQHEEAIRGIQEHLLGVPIQEELTALRFRADIAEQKIASLRAMDLRHGGNQEITRTRERQARVKIEHKLLRFKDPSEVKKQ